MKVEDSDYADWKVGDLVKAIENFGAVTKGSEHIIEEIINSNDDPYLRQVIFHYKDRNFSKYARRFVRVTDSVVQLSFDF